MQKVAEKLKTNISDQNIKRNHILAPYTTFEIGGPADIFITPSEIEEVKWAVSVAEEENISYYVLGNGSNLLIDDNGIRGMVIYLGEKFIDKQVVGNKIIAQSGASLESICNLASEHSLTGMEFSVGIPGTLGGAIFMNAGAFEGQTGDVVEEVICLVDGELKTYSRESMEFGYRTSTFQKLGALILEGTLTLQKGDPQKIKAKMDELTEKRETKQPLEIPSAGSVFKRPEGYYAGKLIQDSDLRGYSVGGAQVSTKHCGFIVNKGEAKSEDVKELIKHIQKTVKEEFGVTLERELKYLGGHGEES